MTPTRQSAVVWTRWSNRAPGATGPRRHQRPVNLFSRKAVWLGVLPGLIVFVGMGLGPSVATAVLSLTNVRQTPGTPWHWVGLQNYVTILLQTNRRDVMAALGHSLYFALVVTVVQTAFALLLASILNNKGLRGRNLSRTVIFLPVILGVTVTGLCFKLFFSIDGPANAVLGWFGTRSNFFASWTLAMPLVIFVQIWMSVGYAMVIFLAGLQNIPEELYESATIDGANSRQRFWRITIPMLWPTLTINLLLCLIGALSAFMVILITTNASPPTTTLAMMVYQYAFGLGGGGSSSGQQGLAAAVAMLLFFFILIFTLALRITMNARKDAML